MEGFKKLEKKTGVVEMGVLIAALFSALDAMPAQALEIEPSASWQNGVEHSVRESVRKDKIEHGAIYAQFTDGSGTWLPALNGEAQKMTMNARELQRQARSYGKTVLNICILHTHPTEVNRTHIKIPGVAPESVPIPPSAGDLSTARSKELFPQGANKFTFGAADSLGVWYFSEKESKDNSHSVKVDDNGFRTAYADFIVKSTRKGFDFNAELPKLQQAYSHYLNGEVRFVSYEQIKKEPPCSGVGSSERVAESNPAISKNTQTEENRPGTGKVTIDFNTAQKTFRPPQ